MGFTFVHSADWHLGQTYWALGASATRSRAWRFEAVRRLWQLAREHDAAFILVAGDVFETETPAPAVREQTLELLEQAPAPVYLLPGQSDPCAEGSVWFDAKWQGALAQLPTVRALLANETWEIEGDALLFPCPSMRKRATRDVTAHLPVGARGERFRIGMAHGYLNDYDAGEKRTLGCIASDCAARAGLDYLALGGQHAATPHDHSAARARSFYAGTPEIGAHDDARGGNALVVSLQTGAPPDVAAHRVGNIELCDLGAIELNGAADWERFVARASAMGKPEKTILRARLRGEVSPALWSEMQRWLAAQRESLLGVDVTLELHPRPTAQDFADLKLERLEESILERLNGTLGAEDAGDTRGLELLELWSGDASARREALALYYRLLGG